MDNLEKQIQEAGADKAPRITATHIQSKIKSEHYFSAAAGVEGESRFGNPQPSDATDYPDSLKLLTICVLVLENGFTVTGESACASPENFNAAIGRNVARDNAIEKVWMLEGYLLKQKLYDDAQVQQQLKDFSLDDCEGGGCKI